MTALIMQVPNVPRARCSVWRIYSTTSYVQSVVITACCTIIPPNHMNISADSPLLKLLEGERKVVVTEELEREEEELRESNPRKKLLQDSILQLKKLEAAISFPLIAHESIIGIFNLGEKISGDMYTDEDINLLSSICHQMAIAIENQKLQEETLVAQQQVLQADKMVTAGTLAASYAHDIRSPLAVVKGLAQALSLSDEPDLETVEKIKKMVPGQIDRVEKMINQILGFVRSQPGIETPVDLKILLDEVAELLEVHTKKGIQVVKEFPKGDVSVKGRRDALFQALTNVALNAVQAMPNGGRLTFALRAGNPNVIVEISDTGEGILAENISRVFAPFFTTKATGVGLGLSIVQRVVNEHHGRVSFTSEVGKGTRFAIELPK